MRRRAVPPLPPVAVSADGCAHRLGVLRRDVLAAAGAAAAVLTRPSVVAALTGVWLETATVMPARGAWLLVDGVRPPRLLVHELEAELARGRCPPGAAELTTVGDDRSRAAAARAWLADVDPTAVGGGAALGCDDEDLRVADHRALVDRAGPEPVDLSARLWRVLRPKSAAEAAQLRAGADALARAVAATLAAPRSAHDTELTLAARLAAATYETSGDWYDVVPIVCSGPRLTVPHARPVGRVPQPGELCRVGVRARYGPYHLMGVRSAVVRPGGFDRRAGVCAETARDAAAVLGALRPGASYREVVAAAPPGERAVPIAVAQGMGFAFKERPQLDPDSDDTLDDGDVVLVSRVVADRTGARAYWQQLAVVTGDPPAPAGRRRGDRQ